MTKIATVPLLQSDGAVRINAYGFLCEFHAVAEPDGTGPQPLAVGPLAPYARCVFVEVRPVIVGRLGVLDRDSIGNFFISGDSKIKLYFLGWMHECITVFPLLNWVPAAC